MNDKKGQESYARIHSDSSYYYLIGPACNPEHNSYVYIECQTQLAKGFGPAIENGFKRGSSNDTPITDRSVSFKSCALYYGYGLILTCMRPNLPTRVMTML